ncbi:MAG: hypothetical protein R6V85_03090 [Polyangia bacterium]
MESESRRCGRNERCPPNAICAAGGCLILLSSEYRELWKEDVAAQLDAGVSWQPHATFGERHIATPHCPAKIGEVDPPDEGVLQPVAEVRLVWFDEESMHLHEQIRTKGSMWFDEIRFWLPPGLNVDSASTCASKEVTRISIGKGGKKKKQAPYVDASLVQAAPVGKIAKAAVSVETEAPEADGEGYRLLVLHLEPTRGEEAEAHTVVAFPLGSDLIAIEGPPPARQRLLNGYAAYYWRHGDEQSEIALRFRLPEAVVTELDPTQISP